jgi:hypothetical protein
LLTSLAIALTLDPGLSDLGFELALILDLDDLDISLGLKTTMMMAPGRKATSHPRQEVAQGRKATTHPRQELAGNMKS